MKKIDAHLHLAKIVAGYCRRGELRAIGATMAMTASQLSRLWRSWTATMWRELF